VTEHRVELLGLLPEELELLLRGLGQPAYRARQLFSWLHRGASFAEMSDLPQALRTRLAELATVGSLEIAETRTASDGAAKFALRTADTHLVESVLIPHTDHVTVCVSSQIGCAFGCSFCATGQQGLTRNLTAGEIVEQVVRVQRARPERRVRNVVFMGMGEPLANYPAVVKAIRLLNDPHGLQIGARHIAVSTCGLPEQIRRLAREHLQIGLSISLHAPTDDVRNKLVPINRTHPLSQVMTAARVYAEVTGRKIAFAYVVIPGLNDTVLQARQLARLIRGIPAMVNLIPQNPTPGVGEPDRAPAQAFANLLKQHGVEVAVRRSRGAEVLGACGQLRGRGEAKGNAGRDRPARRRNRSARG
jgi:23S rRNA (adenine2503-C2)-methyltransferase